MNLFSKLRELKILLVDDDEWIRNSLSLFFEDEGCHLAAFTTAEDGLEELRKQRYDIIVVDYRLPGMDGLEFLEKIKIFHPNVLTVLVTAYGSKNLRLKGREIGVEGFIDKPFTLKAFEEALSCLVEEKSHHMR